MKTVAVIGVLFAFAIVVGYENSSADSPVMRETKTYQYAHAYAKRYRLQRDDLQRRLTRRVLEVRRLRFILSKHAVPNAVTAIRLVFGPYGEQAIRVSSCETGGTFDVNAQNGQYLGLFQMGSYARARYGHSTAALSQAQSAYRYFVDSGRDWSPWECKP